MNPLFSKKTSALLAGLAIAASAAFAQQMPAGHPSMDAGSGSDEAAAPSVPPPSPVSKDGTLDLDKVTFKVPEGWSYEVPELKMRQAQFRLPKAEGDDADGDIAIFYFGPGGGSIDDNVNRWYGQFEQPDGKPSESVAKREKVKAGPLDVTLVDLTGTMKASMMSASAGKPKTGYRMLAAIAETPSGPWFVKATGPAKTMEKHSKAFREFALSVKAK